MTAAIFALIGTLVGVVGTLTVELTRSRRENIRVRREALRLVSADFTAAVARLITLTLEFSNPEVTQVDLMYETHREANVCYERIRLISTSRAVQEAGRHVIRYAYGLLLEVQNLPRRNDELERGPRLLLNDWLIAFYTEVRREIGIPQPENIYREPEKWLVRHEKRAPNKNTGLG
jgi:hypothetical protein